MRILESPLDALRRPAAVAALALLAACADRGDPVVAPDPDPAPRTPVLLGALQCTGDVRAGTVRCGQGALPSQARGYVIVGGQNQYVSLASSNVSYNGGTQVLSADVSVQNLIPQPMGTSDGTTPDAEGVRIIFHTGPATTVGTGTVTLANSDGTGTFTGAGQPFFRYTTQLGGDGILSQNETSANRTWQFNVPATVVTFTFQLYVVAEVPHPAGYVDVTPPADTLVSGGTTPLAGTVRTVVGDAAGGSITWGTSNAAIATVDGSGVVTGVAPGAVTITATSGARTGSATLQVCPSLAVGGVYVATGASVCIGTGGAAAEYTLTPVNLGVANAAFTITGYGIVPVTGPPTPLRAAGMPVRFAGRPVADDAFHLGLMRRGIELQASLRRVSPPVSEARRNITPGVPVVGAVMTLNVGQGYCTPLDSRSATVKSVGTHVIMMEDNSNPSGGFSIAQYDSLAATFDTLVFPAVAGNFGAPFDVDGNGRVIALYTAAVNDLTPPASSSYIGGFFYSRDLFSTGSCAGSNQGEMFYMLAPDPTGAHGNVRSMSFVKSVTIGTLGHEFQHLINASRRLYGGGGPYPFEQVWLNEGLSHIAEEEVYYASSLHGPGENLDVGDLTASPEQTDRFFDFAEANFGRLRQWLLRPDTAGPFKNVDNLAVRGATWSFLRYAADRKGGLESTLWDGLAFSPDTGLTNLANRLATDPKPWFRDWAAAMYLDDAVSGVPSTYTQPSWNFRSIYAALDYNPGPGCSCAYELAMRNPSNGVALPFTVSQGAGAGYVRMGVPASAFAGVTFTAPSATLGVVVMRTK